VKNISGRLSNVNLTLASITSLTHTLSFYFTSVYTEYSDAAMGGNEPGSSAGPSSITMAPPVVSTPLQTDYESYWQSANRAAEPVQASIRRRLPHFPSPPLRIQRVSQLDAEILDTELTSMLLEPLKMTLRNIKSTLPLTLEPELLLTLRLILYKFSVFERGATYGAMLQNLRYRNEWAHSGGLQSTSKDASLSRIQLTLFPALTILLPYLHEKLERRMSHLSYSDMPSNDPRRLLWNGMDRLQRVYAALSLANFLAFLSDGRYGIQRGCKHSVLKGPPLC
jgi:peroxin-2